MAKQILIVGGGVGGTMTANHLVAKLYPEILAEEVKIKLLSDSPWHYYKPAFMYVAFNMFFKDELRRKERSLLRPEIDFEIDSAVHFDFKNKTVKTLRATLHYDYLVIATGCLPAPERIEGLKEAGDYFYQYKPALRLSEKFQKLQKGRVLITVSFPKTPNVPHQCGIAPMETTFILDDYLRSRGIRDKVEIVYTYPKTAQLQTCALFLQKPTSEALPYFFESKGIKYKRGFTLSKVDPEAKIAYSEEGEKESFDILMATPPIRAVDAVIDSGISDAADNEGWLPTDRETLKVKGTEGVYVLGDTVDLPVSKAGGTCHNQSPVIVNNIASEIRFSRTSDIYEGRVVAIAQMGMEAGMPLWYNYKEDVQPLPPNKLGSLMRKGFNRGIYWAVARGIV